VCRLTALSLLVQELVHRLLDQVRNALPPLLRRNLQEPGTLIVPQFDGGSHAPTSYSLGVT